MNASALAAAAEVARVLHEERGIPRDQAIALAARAAMRIHGAGLGQDILTATAQAAGDETVKKVREAVSPWLWVLSIASFVMGIVRGKK